LKNQIFTAKEITLGSLKKHSKVHKKVLHFVSFYLCWDFLEKNEKGFFLKAFGIFLGFQRSDLL